MREEIIQVFIDFLTKFSEVTKDSKDNVLIKVKKQDSLMLLIWNELETSEQFNILHKFIDGDIHSVMFRM